MSIERVREYLAQRGAEQRIIEFESSSATVELAAQAAGVEPGRIAKTLSFHTEQGPILIVAAGDARINNRAFKDSFHAKKPKMLDHDEVEALIGHAVGGVCPFAVNPGVRIYLDQSLRRFPTVFPACGSSNSAIELSCDELERLSEATAWVDVCKPKDDAEPAPLSAAISAPLSAPKAE